MQGAVPLADRQDGRNKQGYSCNLDVIGQYQGEGASWVDPSYGNCAYLGTSFGGVLTKKSPGTQVVDVSDPAHPGLSTNLTSPAMLTDPWESLKVNPARGLLAGVSVGAAESGVFFDVYDIATDCAHPRLLNRTSLNLPMPANVIGHEGGWAPDGRTYYAAGSVAGSLTAIDVSDPAQPRIVYTGAAGIPVNHGLSLSADGNRMYLAEGTGGVAILDTSDIQSRQPVPVIRQVGSVSWTDGTVTQHTIPITVQGKPYLVAVDEYGAGAVRFIDISDEHAPVVTNHVRLAIQTPQYVDERRADTTGDGMFGYEAHYCSVNRPVDPTRLACGEFQSGVRVFDISNLASPRELAYFNPPAQAGKQAQLPGSEHAAGLGTGGLTGVTVSDVSNGDIGDPWRLYGAAGPADLSTDWCSSPPRFVGTDQLWVTCQDNGFLALRFTNGAGG